MVMSRSLCTIASLTIWLFTIYTHRHRMTCREECTNTLYAYFSVFLSIWSILEYFELVSEHAPQRMEYNGVPFIK